MPEKIAEDTYKIKGEGNIYIILKPEPILIDASDNLDREYVSSEIRKVVDPEEVKKVLLTHLHYDHCGNIDLFPNAQVYASNEELENFQNSPQDFFIQGISPEAKKKLEKARVLPEEINGLKIIKVPGHTKGSVAFLDEKRKLLFSGDTLFDNGIGRTDFSNSIPNVMEESVNKLAGLLRDNNLTLCPGHDY